MGSEMCIRDRIVLYRVDAPDADEVSQIPVALDGARMGGQEKRKFFDLLYILDPVTGDDVAVEDISPVLFKKGRIACSGDFRKSADLYIIGEEPPSRRTRSRRPRKRSLCSMSPVLARRGLFSAARRLLNSR